MPVSETYIPTNPGNRFLGSWIGIAIVMLAMLAITWAIFSQARVSLLQNDVLELRQENARLRENATATVYTFTTTSITPPNMRGTVYLSTSGSGIIGVRNLPPTGDDHTFRIWLISDNVDASGSGSLFITPTGEGFALLPADSSGYASIAISLEPDNGGNVAGSYLLVVDVHPARGFQHTPLL